MSWGPQGRAAAIAVSFDNLGEASDLERGQWPVNAPLGHHFSVTRALPWVLETLAEAAIRATFFVEGLNAELYPEALRAVDAAGHEIAYHGWSHEVWADLDPARERELLARGVGALGGLGLAPVGFRPPGGELIPSSPRSLTTAGFTYCSPAGVRVEVADGLVRLPFEWALIDAFHYLPHFAPRRRAALGSTTPLAPSALRSTLGHAIDAAVRRGGFLTLLFHPFLLDTDERRAVLRAVLDDLRARIDERAVWCAPLRDVAAAVASPV